MPGSVSANGVREDWVDHALGVLSAAGHRRSGAREAVIRLLAEQRCALTAKEIEDSARERVHTLGRASVYRALELLVERGLVARVEVGQGVTRYEPSGPGDDHHHHLVCDRCGRIVPFSDGELERSLSAAIARIDRGGARVDEHEVVLRGACERCA